MAKPKKFECIDVFGYNIGCTKSRWKHICERHAETVFLENLVISIIGKPDFVNRSRSYANRFTFYRKAFIIKLGRAEIYIRVVIEYNMDENQKWRGCVISAMPCDGSQLGEVTVWRGRAI